jgi:hypothetical protein
MLPFNNVHVASLIGSRIIAPQGRWRNMGKKGEGARESSTSRIRPTKSNHVLRRLESEAHGHKS